MPFVEGSPYTMQNVLEFIQLAAQRALAMRQGLLIAKMGEAEDNFRRYIWAKSSCCVVKPEMDDMLENMFLLDDNECFICSWLFNDFKKGGPRRAEDLLIKVKQFIGLMCYWQRGAMLFDQTPEHYGGTGAWVPEGNRLLKFIQDSGILCINLTLPFSKMQANKFNSVHYSGAE